MGSRHLDSVRRYLLGDRRLRWTIVATVAGLLAVASVAFLLGASVGLYEAVWGWLAIAIGIAIIAGIAGAGLVSTVVSLWLISLWGYAFPPLVGYLSGEWTSGGRYTHPRLAAYAYGSARAELHGGIETATEAGLMFAIVVGTFAYIVGAVTNWIVQTRDSFR